MAVKERENRPAKDPAPRSDRRRDRKRRLGHPPERRARSSRRRKAALARKKKNRRRSRPKKKVAQGRKDTTQGESGQSPQARPKPPPTGPGREETLARQTPDAGRSREGADEPDADETLDRHGRGRRQHAPGPGLERARRQLREVEERAEPAVQPEPGPADHPTARSGRHELLEREDHNEVSRTSPPGMWTRAGKMHAPTATEAPGGDNPTPDQDRVDDIGKALGVQYEDNEELKASDKIAERDRKRWELDPASSDDYKDRD